MARAAAAGVPGARVEGTRVKEASSQAGKEARGKPAHTTIDNLGARLSAPSRDALERVKKNLEARLPVESKEKITSNGLNIDQYGVRTGGKGQANQVSEIQVVPKEQVSAMKETEPLYEKQKEAEAAGDAAGAARIGAEIEAVHRAAQGAGNGERGTAEKPAAERETKYKFGSTQANIPPGSEAGAALKAARAKIDPEDLMASSNTSDGGGLENEPHVTVRYGIEGDDHAGIRRYLAAQKPFTAKLGKTSSFPVSEHSDGAAPIVAPVESDDLRRIESELDQHGNFAERSFPEYKPHATVAYVKPEKAAKYTGMADTEGKRFTVNSISIAKRDGSQTRVRLEGRDPDVGGKLAPGDVVALRDGRAGVVQFVAAPNGLPPRARVRLADGKVLNAVPGKTLTRVTVAPVDPESGWTGVDLDGTLAQYDGFKGAETIGAPVAKMVEHVKKLLAAGEDVRIFSARISDDPKGMAKAAIEAWCKQYLGEALPVTQVKDARMVKLYDDRAVQVRENKGGLVGGAEAEREAGDAHRQSEKAELRKM
jgi:2'-5' RNA ligase